MKKQKITLLLALSLFTLLSCSKDDNEIIDTSKGTSREYNLRVDNSEKMTSSIKLKKEGNEDENGGGGGGYKPPHKPDPRDKDKDYELEFGNPYNLPGEIKDGSRKPHDDGITKPSDKDKGVGTVNDASQPSPGAPFPRTKEGANQHKPTPPKDYTKQDEESDKRNY